MTRWKEPSNYNTLHQKLVISDINFKRAFIRGSTELTIEPLTSNNKIWKLPLNCKQCRILRISINGGRKADFVYIDPMLCICPPDSKKRNLGYYNCCHGDAVWSCDRDGEGNPELIVKIPRSAYDVATLRDRTPLKILIEFSLEQPQGGIQFVHSESLNDTHAFTYRHTNSSRLWFPCVDSYSDVCQWSLSYTVPSNMTVVSCGDLTQQVLSADGRKKTFDFQLSVPTSASLIGFSIGCFEIFPDPSILEVTHFTLPGTLSILKNTVKFVHEVFEFYEELLSSGFPHSSYKLVFVNNSYNSVQTYASMTIFPIELLHPPTIIDDVYLTRRLIALGVAKQYFGSYMLQRTWGDWWLVQGLPLFIAGLFIRKIFGRTEYQHWIMEELNKLCNYESNNYLPPLLGDKTDRSPAFHPHLCNDVQLEMLSIKSHLVLRMIQLKIGHDLLLQVFNKLLTLASSAVQSDDSSQQINMLLSTEVFLKLILTVSGKDMTHFAEQWIARNGLTAFHCSFSYIRKKNQVELRMVQEPPKGYHKFIGPMTVIIQEFDGCFTHTIQIEENTSTYDLPCHSKIRKAKRRKVPLSHGEELEIDVSSLDLEVPVMWITVDPEMAWISLMNIQQPDTIWQNVLNYERDPVAQIKAIEALKGFPSLSTRTALKDAILNELFFYNVRIKAADALSSVLTDLCASGEGGSPDVLIRIYRQLFCVTAYHHVNLVKDNNFSDFSAYFVQKSLPKAISKVRNTHSHCPKEVLAFIMDVIKFSDNQSNQYHDGYYRASLVDALAAYITPPIAVLHSNKDDFAKNPVSLLQPDVQTILQEIVKFINIDKILPSYKYSVTVSCLKALRVLQYMGHLPSSSDIFKEYTNNNVLCTVRHAAFEAIIDIVHADQSEADLNYLLDTVEDFNQLPSIRLLILQGLALKPPFTRRSESTLNTLQLVERLWTMICRTFSSDSRLRNAATVLYYALYDNLTPTCVPEGLGMVINLKNKVARSNKFATSPKSIEEEMETSLPMVTEEIDDHTHSSKTVLKVPTMKLKLPELKLERAIKEDSPYSLLGEEEEMHTVKPPKHKKHKSEHKHKKKHKKKNKHSLCVD